MTDILDLIGDIYEAGAMPGLWRGLLGKIAESNGAVAGMLLANTRDGLLGTHSSGYDELVVGYRRAGWATDTTRFNWLTNDKYAGFRTDTDFASIDELRRIPVYSEFLIPHGVDAGAATLIYGAHHEHLLLSIEGFPNHRSARDALPKLDALRPHFARAAMLSSQLRLQQVKAAVTALEMIGVAAAMIGQLGTVRVLNDLFERDLAQIGLVKDRRIQLFNTATDRRLRTAFAGAPLGLGDSIPLAQNGEVFVLHVLPVLGSAKDVFADCAAMVLISTVRKAPLPELQLLRSLYDLTPMEAKVAQRLGRSVRPAEIASELAISVETARTHIKAVHSKVGISRSVELTHIFTALAKPAAD